MHLPEFENGRRELFEFASSYISKGYVVGRGVFVQMWFRQIRNSFDFNLKIVKR